MNKLERRNTNVILPQLPLLSSILIKIIVMAIFGLFFLAVPVFGDGPPMPPDISGKVCYSDGEPVVSANVTLININKTDKKTQTTTNSNGEWSVNMWITIGAEDGDEILITAFVPKSEEKEKSVRLVVDRSNYTQEVNFVFEKESEDGAQGLPSDGDGGSGDGSASDELPEEKTNAMAMGGEKGVENISEKQSSPSPSPSHSAIEKGNESVAGEGQSETPSPLKEEGKDEEGEGKSKSIPGFQFMYAGAAGLTAIAALFIIRKIKLRREGGIEKR